MQLAIEMAEALAYTHSQGILHRDLKPSNVLLTPSAQPMLLDFNLSCDIHLDVGRVGGTLPYMPPEQIREVHEPAESRIRRRRSAFGHFRARRDPLRTADRTAALRRSAGRHLTAGGCPVVPGGAATPPVAVNRLNRQVDRALAETGSCLPRTRPRRATGQSQELNRRLKRRFSRSQRLRRWAVRYRWPLGSGIAVAALAIGLSANYLATRPPYHERKLQEGIAQLAKDDFAEALPYLELAVESDPDDVRARFARGVALHRGGEHLRALPDLQFAVDSQPFSVMYEVLGDALLALQKTRDAFLNYKLAAATDSRPEIRIKQAYAMDRDGLRGPAESLLDQVLTEHPRSQLAYHLRAEFASFCSRRATAPPTRC